MGIQEETTYGDKKDMAGQQEYRKGATYIDKKDLAGYGNTGRNYIRR